MRRVHQLMVDAALTGDGFDRMAELAAQEVGRPIGIVLPELDVAVVWPGGHDEELDALRTLTEARVESRRASIPQEVDLVVPISFGDRLVGAVGMLAGESGVEGEASEFLHLAATSSATALALEEAREREAVETHGGVFEQLVAGTIEPEAAVRRAAAEGCDLSAGLIVSRDRRRGRAAARGAVGDRVRVSPVAGRAGRRSPLRARPRAAGRAPCRGGAGPAPAAVRAHRHLVALRRPARDRTRGGGGRDGAGGAFGGLARGAGASTAKAGPASTGCCSGRWPRIPRRSAASTRTRSRRWSSTTRSTAATCCRPSSPTSATTAT